VVIPFVSWIHLIEWRSHCPWVWNCGMFSQILQLLVSRPTHPPVGLNNHRQFIIFVTALVIGICLFDYLTWACKYYLFHPPTSVHRFSTRFLIDRRHSRTVTHLLPPRFRVQSYGHRHVPFFCCRLGDSPARLDRCATFLTVFPNRTTNDNARSVQSRPIRLYGWAR
jgi:hypothetical protein